MNAAASVAEVDVDEAMRSVADSFERIALAARRSGRRAAADLGEDLPPAVWPVLREVLRADRIQASAIVTTLGMDKSAVSRLLKDLREHGLVDAERDEHDARAYWILPTPLARQRAAEILRVQQDRLRAQLAGWDEQDLERFAVLLDRLAGPPAP
jgi:DNA-binding MarR family transcriptional regulator